MTHRDDPTPELRGLGLSLEPSDLDGHTVEDLSDYLDAGRSPADASIDGSPGCQLALAAMERLRNLSEALLRVDAEAVPALDEGWVSRILGAIAFEARAGRRIPIAHPAPTADLGITEGAVRGIVRSAEADVDGVVVGRCRLDGDLSTAGAPVTVTVDASVLWGASIPVAAERLRSAILRRLAAHTELNVVAVDVTVHDIHHLPGAEEERS